MNWDILCKTLLEECIEDFVDYFAPGAKFVRFVEGQVQTRVDEPWRMREVRADVVVEVAIALLHFLLHFEFQSRKHKRIDRRLLTYSGELTDKHELNVLSVAFYTRLIRKMALGPLKRCIPVHPNGEREVLHFGYETFNACNMTVEELRQIGKDGFLPFMLLAKGGAHFSVLEEVLEKLRKPGREQVAAIAIIFASAVFKSKIDRQLLEGKEKEMEAFLKKTPIYQRMKAEINQEELNAQLAQGLAVGHEKGLKEGRKEGIKEGRKEGIKEARTEEVRRNIENIEALTRARFPQLLAVVKERLASLADLSKLQDLLLLVGTASTEEEVQQSLLALS